MINKVILMGRLTADPELKQTTSNISMCRFSIAIDRAYTKDKERQTDFINIVVWRQTAEFVHKYFSKGKMIIVEGRLQNNNYTDGNGVKHYTFDVVADNVSFGESKGSTDNADSVSQQHSAPPPAKANTTPQTAPSQAIEVGDLKDFEEILSDGEVPF